jgi:hypothetical protein
MGQGNTSLQGGGGLEDCKKRNQMAKTRDNIYQVISWPGNRVKKAQYSL